jgi:hypothetical protein
VLEATDGHVAREEEELRRRLQRDINCLYDPDRTTRRRALTKLKKEVVESPAVGTTCCQGRKLYVSRSKAVERLTLWYICD